MKPPKPQEQRRQMPGVRLRSPFLLPVRIRSLSNPPGSPKNPQKTSALWSARPAWSIFTYRLQAVGTSIQVEPSPELAQTESSTLGRAVDLQTIEALPLSNRNYTQILSLSPGIVVELPNASALGRGTQNVTANGNKTTGNNIQFNGVDANNLAGEFSRKRRSGDWSRDTCSRHDSGIQGSDRQLRCHLRKRHGREC